MELTGEACRAQGIPSNLRLTDSNIYVQGKSGRWFPVASRFEVAALTCDENGSGWGRLLKFPDGRTWIMPAALLAGRSAVYRAKLRGFGVTLYPGRIAGFGLYEFLVFCQPTARVRTHG
jgi:hypothetical protein